MNQKKINEELIIRMYRDHNYSIDDICLRLRYTPELINFIIKKHGLKNAN